MKRYILKRLLLMIPTLLGIITLNFFFVQLSPGGPLETMIARATGEEVTADERGSGQYTAAGQNSPFYNTSQIVTPELIEDLEKLYGFDKPICVRYLLMIKRFVTFDFGESFFRDRTVTELIKEKLPVSVSLGLWSTLIVYLVSIPLGIKKAVGHSGRFDVWTSFFIIIGSAVPVFLFAVFMVIFFAGGNYLTWFPMGGLVSDNFAEMSFLGKVKDYLWHMVLPVSAITIGGFASLTMLTKNSFLDELGRQYVTTARAKGITEKRVLYGHVFRNSMLIVISGFPRAFFSMFFTGSLMIEIIFSLDGMGLLGFEAALSRDYPVMFSTLYIFTLMGLIMHLVTDITYMLIDPRITFKSARGGE